MESRGFNGLFGFIDALGHAGLERWIQVCYDHGRSSYKEIE
jgi:hypothetical protein